MYIALDDGRIAPQDFVVCEFYGVETCFCWDADKLVAFPYKAYDGTARDVRILSTPAPVRQVQCFDGRIFVVCEPHGVYKLSRASAFALLSKNAVGIGADYSEVLIAKGDGVYLDNKQIKSSRLLFPCSVALKEIGEQLRVFTLIHGDTEDWFLKCFTDSDQPQAAQRNLCVIAHGKKLYALTDDTSVRLVHTSDTAITHIAPVKRGNKVAGLLLLHVNLDTVILAHSTDDDEPLIFEKVRLGRGARSVSALCAFFSLQLENTLWIVYCDRSKLYFVQKKLHVDAVQEVRIEERTFVCLQHYQSNVILCLSEMKELIDISIETLENSLSMDNNVALHTNMFQKTDFVMEEIYMKVKELDALYKRLADEQDKLKRINLYACERKLKITPYMEVSKVQSSHFLTLSIPEKLPKNCYVAFALVSNNKNTFCMKKVTETDFTINMLINKNSLCSVSINIDLITLVNEEAPWCLIRNFISCPLQKEIRKRGQKRDKTAFIDAKIALLQNLIAEKNLNMTKLREIKKIVRAEL